MEGLPILVTSISIDARLAVKKPEQIQRLKTRSWRKLRLYVKVGQALINEMLLKNGRKMFSFDSGMIDGTVAVTTCFAFVSTGGITYLGRFSRLFNGSHCVGECDFFFVCPVSWPVCDFIFEEAVPGKSGQFVSHVG